MCVPLHALESRYSLRKTQTFYFTGRIAISALEADVFHYPWETGRWQDGVSCEAGAVLGLHPSQWSVEINRYTNIADTNSRCSLAVVVFICRTIMYTQSWSDKGN